MVLEIIFIFHIPSLLGILVNIQGEMCVVVVIFLYQNICHFLTYFLCINLTVKVKKERVYSVFTHRVLWGGSRKLTTFTIELFLVIVNGLRRSLKIWQGSWIHFKFSLPFATSYVSCFISFYFEATRIFKYKSYIYLWVFYRGVFWMCWRKSSKTFQNITAFKDYAKNIVFLWSHSLYFKILEWMFETIR